MNVGADPACEVRRDGSAILWVPGRPRTINAERRQRHWSERSGQTSSDRQAGWVLGQRLKIAGWAAPAPAVVASLPVYATRRSWPDVGAWLPAVKAVIDGLVDAGTWPDDSVEWVSCLVFDAPMLGGANGLAVSVGAAGPQGPARRLAMSVGAD